MTMKHITALLRSKQTVFTYRSASIILGISNSYTVKSMLYRLTKAGVLVHKYAGIWTLPNYNAYEFAMQIRSPCYISLETVLQQQGIIFQDYGRTITMVSDNTLVKQIDDYRYTYRKIQPAILFDPLGIIHKDIYSMATPERAAADMLYFQPDYYFDNPYGLDIAQLHRIKLIYPPKTILAIDKLIDHVTHSKT